MNQLRDVVNRTAARRGKVIIPSFALGRTQDIVYSLHQLLDSGQIPELPVFVDSPLAVNATEVFLLHPECYDQETRAFLQESHSRNPFTFGSMHYVREVERSKELNDLREPAVIISASGMCETGRILHHLKNNIEDARNTVLIVGWQAPHTLGRRLVEKQERVKIFGDEYVRRADVQVISGYSAHADRGELLGWFKQVQGPGLEHVFVVHGEEEAAYALADAFTALGVPDVLVPEPAQEVSV
jgi:metallo-beta-lactamase family protein